MYSPMTQFLIDLEQRLAKTKIPVKFKLPEPTVREPFYVIGAHSGDDSRSAKMGPAIVDTNLQVDLYYPIASRIDLEEAIFKTKIALNKRVTHRVMIDNSIGREVYHVVFNVSELII